MQRYSVLKNTSQGKIHTKIYRILIASFIGRSADNFRGSTAEFNTHVMVASIPGRVFAFITVRRTTGPGTSCLRMRQIFIVFVVGKDI